MEGICFSLSGKRWELQSSLKLYNFSTRFQNGTKKFAKENIIFEIELIFDR